MSLTIGEHRRALDAITVAVETAGPEFPDVSVTKSIADLIGADAAGAGAVDLRGPSSHRWADVPAQVPLPTSGGFHELATRHPLSRVYARGQASGSLRLSEMTAGSDPSGPSHNRHVLRETFGMRDTLTIPLRITPRWVVAIALMRSDHDFSDHHLELADRIRPALAAMYRLGRVIYRTAPSPQSVDPFDPDTGIRLTSREITVLEFLSRGMIAEAIARRLGISSRTVSKHLQSTYRKLGVDNKVSAVLRAQSLNLLGTRSSS